MGLFLYIFFGFLTIEQRLCFGQVTDAEYSRMPTLFSEDNFDDCMLDKENSLYCSFSYWLEPKNPTNPSQIWTTIKKVSDVESNYRHDHLRHRICVRETCPNVDLQSPHIAEQIDECYDKKFESKGLKGNLTDLKCVDAFSKYPIETADLVFGAFVVLYIAFVVFASIYEGSARYKSEKEYKQITETRVGRLLSAFSLPKNWYRLTEKPKTADAKKLSAIQGVRFYNMICVIMAHTMMADMSELVSNPKFVEGLTKNVQNTIVSNGGYVVQTNMLISSWLLTYQFLTMFEGKKRVPFRHVIFTFINRLMRLTPTYAFVLFMQATWLVHFSNGPNWDALVGEEYRNCRRNWWINLLYLNNFIDKERMCMQHMWYLATDTQLFLFLIILLMFLYNNPSKAKTTIAVLTIVGVVLPGIITYIYNFDFILRQYPENMYRVKAIRQDIFAYAYAFPLSNIGGYMIGIICGYMFYHYKDRQFPNGKLATLTWWILSFGLPLSTIFFASLAYNTNIQFTRLHAALYWALGRNIFALGIACTIFGMTQGIGWFPRWVCEWEAVTVYGRISYSAYIVHCALIRLRMGITRWPTYNSEGILFHKVLGDVTTTYIFALLLSLFVEMPTSALQKFWVPQLPKTETRSTKSEPDKNGTSNGMLNGHDSARANGNAKEIKAE